MNRFTRLRYAVSVAAVVVGWSHTALGQSFAIESNGIPQSGITLSIPNGKTMPPITYEIVSTTDTQIAVSLDLEVNSNFILSQSSGTTPFFVTLSQQTFVDNFNEVYSGTLTISSTAKGTVPVLVPIEITFGPTHLNSMPGQLNFGYQTGTTVTGLTKILTLSAGTRVSYSLSVEYAQTGTGWLMLNSSRGTVSAGVNSSTSVTAVPAALAPGAYSATIQVSATGTSYPVLSIPVTLLVSNTPLLLTSTPLPVTFDFGSPSAQTFSLTSSSTPLAYTTAISYDMESGTTNWLTITPVSGQTPTELTFTVNPLLASGYYVATVTVASPEAANSPLQLYVIVLNVLPSGVCSTCKVPKTLVSEITKVQNSASFAYGGVSPGELVYLEGTNLGPDTLVQLNVDSNGMIFNSLDDTQVLFDGEPAPLVYAAANKIVAIVPYGVAGGTTIEVRHGIFASFFPMPLLSLSTSVPVVATAPGIYTADSSGGGQAAAVNIKENGGFSYNGPGCTPANPKCGTEPAPVGSVITIYGTGEGLVSPPPLTGSITPPIPPYPAIMAPLTVKLGGVPIDPSDILYAGPAPTLAAGVFQINFRIPKFVVPGVTPLQVVIGQNPSNYTTIVVGPAE